MNPRQAEMFWEIAHAHWPLDSVFRYFAKRPETGEVFGCAVASQEALASITDWADREGWNSYWQPNPTTRKVGTRCSSADITCWSYFVMDFDPAGTEPLDPDDAYPRILAALRDTPFGDSAVRMVIDSGRGLQLLFPLNSFLLGPSLRDRVSVTSSYHTHALAKLFKDQAFVLDTSCSDLPRPMRMPFTINQKTHNLAVIREYHMLPANEGLAEALLASIPGEMLVNQQKPPSTTGPLGCWMDYLPFLTRAGRVFLTEGQEAPGRHKAAAAAMLSLLDAGCPVEHILAALAYGAKNCEPPLPQGEVAAMVARKYKNVLARKPPVC